ANRYVGWSIRSPSSAASVVRASRSEPALATAAWRSHASVSRLCSLTGAGGSSAGLRSHVPYSAARATAPTALSTERKVATTGLRGGSAPTTTSAHGIDVVATA